MQLAFFYHCPTWIKIKSQEEVHRLIHLLKWTFFPFCDRLNIALNSPHITYTPVWLPCPLLGGRYDPQMYSSLQRSLRWQRRYWLSTHQQPPPPTSSIPWTSKNQRESTSVSIAQGGSKKNSNWCHYSLGKGMALEPSSAVKHTCAQFNLQPVCHNIHLSLCSSSGEIM